MNLHRIKKLIQKYEKGESSLKEEQELKLFFTQKDVPFQLAGYKDLFQFYNTASYEEIADPDFDDKVLQQIERMENGNKRQSVLKTLYPVIGIAAGILLLIGFYFVFVPDKNTGTYNDPELAYAEAKKILLKVSGNLNTGVDELSNVKELQTGLEELNNIKTFDEGLNNMKKISILDKSKEIINKNNK